MENEALDPADLQIWLNNLDRWWRESKNPLYIWEAIARCLNVDPPAPIPAWCLPYLAEAARNITDLSWRCGQRRLSHSLAAGRVTRALGLTRQGFNAFREIPADRQAMRGALDERDGRPLKQVLKEIARSRSITKDRARRVVGEGRKLLGTKRRP
jgi:hypothetical protein